MKCFVEATYWIQGTNEGQIAGFADEVEHVVELACDALQTFGGRVRPAGRLVSKIKFKVASPGSPVDVSFLATRISELEQRLDFLDRFLHLQQPPQGCLGFPNLLPLSQYPCHLLAHALQLFLDTSDLGANGDDGAANSGERVGDGGMAQAER